MTSPLADPCGELRVWLPAAMALVAEPDTDGTAVHGKPGSRPPWNSAAANAVLDAHQGTRRLEAELVLEVTGRVRRIRGGSDGNTLAAIQAIGDLAVNASQATVIHVGRSLGAFVTVIQQLPAIDEAERFHRVQGVACQYCGNTMLRLGERSGRVTCVRFGACWDTNGDHPVGFVTHSVHGEPMIAWADGCNQYAGVTTLEGA